MRRWGFTPFGQTAIWAVGTLAFCIAISGTVEWRSRVAIATALCLGFLWGQHMTKALALDVVEEAAKKVGVYTEEDAAREREEVSKMDL